MLTAIVLSICYFLVGVGVGMGIIERSKETVTLGILGGIFWLPILLVALGMKLGS